MLSMRLQTKRTQREGLRTDLTPIGLFVVVVPYIRATSPRCPLQPLFVCVVQKGPVREPTQTPRRFLKVHTAHARNTAGFLGLEEERRKEGFSRDADWPPG